MHAKSAQDAATMDPPLLIDQMEQCLEPLAQIRAQLDAARDKSGFSLSVFADHFVFGIIWAVACDHGVP